MTPAISTLLLVPAAGQEGLLAEGPCGARPPVMFVPPPGHPEHVGRGGRGPFPAVYTDGPHRALVLVYEGEPVPGGFDRLRRATGLHWPEDYAVEALNQMPAGTAVWFQRMREGLAEYNAGTLLALDPSGRDITAEVLGG